MKKPNLFLTGHPRTGTTALHDFLGQHPDIFMSIPKEPVFFATDLHSESDRFHKELKFFHFRTQKQYTKLFEKAHEQKIAGESSAVYLYSKTASEEIYKFNPDAKIIMIFREPVSWLQSYHSKACQIIGENNTNFKKAFLLENERKKGNYLSTDVMSPSLLYYSEFINYTEQAKRFMTLFGRKNIKILIFDDYQADNKKNYSDILKFLDVDPYFLPSFKKINTSKYEARWPAIQRIIQNPKLIKIALSLLPDKVFKKISGAYWEIFYNEGSKSPLDTDFEKQLKTQFKPEVQNLSHFIGRDLIKLWGYDNI